MNPENKPTQMQSSREIPGTEEARDRNGMIIRIPIIPKPSTKPFTILNRPAEGLISTEVK